VDPDGIDIVINSHLLGPLQRQCKRTDAGTAAGFSARPVRVAAEWEHALKQRVRDRIATSMSTIRWWNPAK
jgi:hypothetical protein